MQHHDFLGECSIPTWRQLEAARVPGRGGGRPNQHNRGEAKGSKLSLLALPCVSVLWGSNRGDAGTGHLVQPTHINEGVAMQLTRIGDR